MMFQLLIDVFVDQLSVQFRFMNFYDVQVQFVFGQVCKFFVKLFDVSIFFIDDYIRMCSVDSYVVFFVWMFDDYVVDVGLFVFFVNEVFNFQVFEQQIIIVFGVGVLVVVLGVVDLQVYIDGIYFVIYQVCFLI